MVTEIGAKAPRAKNKVTSSIANTKMLRLWERLPKSIFSLLFFDSLSEDIVSPTNINKNKR